MDALDAERFGPAGALARELVHRPRPVLPPARARAEPRRLATDGTWEEYRQAFADADARLAEATRNGHDDSWWEDDIDHG